MIWIGIIVLIIYCLIPLPLQIIILIGDLIATGPGVDELLLLVAIIVRRLAKSN